MNWARQLSLGTPRALLPLRLQSDSRLGTPVFAVPDWKPGCCGSTGAAPNLQQLGQQAALAEQGDWDAVNAWALLKGDL